MTSRRTFLAAPLVLGFRGFTKAKEAMWAPMRSALPDTAVVDQQGRHLRFYSDLVRGRTVAINFIFTSCSTICTPLTAIFRKVQKSTAGDPIHFISISVDPEQDTPETLARFASQFNAGPGWSFVTGQRSDITDLLRALEAFTVDKLDHTSLVLIGNEAANQWTRISGFSPVARYAATLHEAAGFKKGRV